MTRLIRTVVSLFALAAPLAAQTAAIEGVVTAAGNAPVMGARVAVVPSQEMRPGPFEVAGTAITDSSGHYRVEKLKAGKYAVTATSRMHVGGFIEPKQVADGQTIRVDVIMGSQGRKLTGEVIAPDGRAVAAKITLVRYSPYDGDLFVVESDSSGKFSTMLPPARYSAIAIAPGARVEQRFDLEKADQSLRLLLERSFGQAPPEVVAWIKRNAIPLKTPEAGHGFDDMKPLERIVGDARIVSLGEATHGTREFFQLKHRMLELLVERMGFTVFAIEASTPDTLPVNDYVLHGKGNVGRAVQGMGFWTWDTQEVVEMAKWMRRYNEDPKHTRKLKFLGFDMQSPMSSVRLLKAYLGRVDAEYAKSIETAFDPMRNRGDYGKNVEAQKRVQASIDAVVARLEQSRDAYVARSSAEEWASARRELDLIRQGEQLFRNVPDIRDKSMALNAKWILDQEPPGTKIVLWAHNGHVSRAPKALGGYDPMGMFLDPLVGDQMRVFGFAFDRGSFRAVQPNEGLLEHTVGPAPRDTFDGALAQAEIPLFALDLRNATGVAREWLDSTMPMRSVGSMFVPANEPQYFLRGRPRRLYDAVFFVANTTAAKPRAEAMPRSVGKPKAENLDFEEGVVGDKPPGWNKSGDNDGFEATVVDQGCASGRLCVRVVPAGESPSGFVSLAQMIDATPYRGKKVRLRAKIRSNVTGENGSARLWLRVDRPKGARGFFDNMHDRAPKSLPDWTDLEITGNVADDAEAIAFGLLFIGGGTAWMDGASLEVVP